MCTLICILNYDIFPKQVSIPSNKHWLTYLHTVSYYKYIVVCLILMNNITCDNFNSIRHVETSLLIEQGGIPNSIQKGWWVVLKMKHNPYLPICIIVKASITYTENGIASVDEYLRRYRHFCTTGGYYITLTVIVRSNTSCKLKSVFGAKGTPKINIPLYIQYTYYIRAEYYS